MKKHWIAVIAIGLCFSLPSAYAVADDDDLILTPELNASDTPVGSGAQILPADCYTNGCIYQEVLFDVGTITWDCLDQLCVAIGFTPLQGTFPGPSQIP